MTVNKRDMVYEFIPNKKTLKYLATETDHSFQLTEICLSKVII